jgi:RNA polymerase sigma-70 factor, ECF subfamily
MECELAPRQSDANPNLPPGAGTPPQYLRWVDLVRRVRSRDGAAIYELYQLFSGSVRFSLCKQVGSQDLDDTIHDIFLVVLEAIRRGSLREPERLMGFVRTIVRRQVAAHIDCAVQVRTYHMALDNTAPLPAPEANPEQRVIHRQLRQIAQRALASIPERDREILVRFYLKEQPQSQICAEMGLSDTQFRVIKSRAKARFGAVGRKRLAQSSLERLACA